MRTAAGLLIFFAFAGWSRIAHCATGAVDVSLFNEAVQDGSGVVWAGSADGKLAVFEGKSWRAVSLPKELDGMQLLRMQRGPDGRMLMLWQKPRGVAALTETEGFAIRIRARFSETLREPEIFCDARAGIWIVSAEKIYRLAPGSSEPTLPYTIPAACYDLPLDDQRVPNALHAFEDAEGRVWFWSQSIRRQSASLKGLLLWHQNEWRMEALETLPASRFSFVERKDERQVWIGVTGKGLFAVDLLTREVQPVAEPAPGALRDVRTVKRSGDEMFFVTMAPESQPQPMDLWREHKGVWTKLVAGLDAGCRREPDAERGFLQTASGTLLGGFRSGLWRLRDGKATQLDWRARFPLHTVSRLFALPDGRFLGMELSGGKSDFAVFDLKTGVPAVEPLRVATVPVLQRPAQDPRGHLWMVRPDHPGALARWDGGKWKFHPVPNEIVPLLGPIEIDSTQRVWATWTSRRPVGIFDPGTDHWEVHKNFRSALQAQIGSGRTFQGFALRPSLSSDGRAAFLVVGGALEYFDGKIWRSWNPEEIGGRGAQPKTVFFAPDASLICETSQGRWQFAEATGWKRVALDAATIAAAPPDEVKMREVQACPDRPGTEWVSWDRNGVGWFLRDRALYRTALGMCVPVFEKDEPQPFLDGRRLVYAPVLLDAGGNAVLQTSEPAELVIITPRLRLPETGARLVGVNDDVATIEFSGKPLPIAWRWRRDGGPWSPPTAGKTLHLPFNESGAHTVDVLAIDPELQVDPTPAHLDFEVRIDWPGLITRGVTLLLRGNERQRNEAIALLLRKTDLALPALQEARARADAEQRWWIEAALQAIEREGRDERKLQK